MRTSLMIASALALIALLPGSETRYYKRINNDYVTYVDWSRDKRQSHPDQTIATIRIPFDDEEVVNEALPSGSGQIIDDTVPSPAEYLTPPAPDSPVPQSAPSQLTPQQLPLQQPPPQQLPLQQLPLQQLPLQQQPPQQLPLQQPPPQQPQQTDKWNLGYEASEILVPPVPNEQASQYDTLKIFTLLPTSSLPQGDLLDSFGPAEQESAADSRTPFIDNYRPSRQEEAPRPHSKAPVYTFVKTDPHGHFKWGVHIGH